MLKSYQTRRRIVGTSHIGQNPNLMGVTPRLFVCTERKRQLIVRVVGTFNCIRHVLLADSAQLTKPYSAWVPSHDQSNY